MFALEKDTLYVWSDDCIVNDAEEVPSTVAVSSKNTIFTKY